MPCVAVALPMHAELHANFRESASSIARNKSFTSIVWPCTGQGPAHLVELDADCAAAELLGLINGCLQGPPLRG